MGWLNSKIVWLAWFSRWLYRTCSLRKFSDSSVIYQPLKPPFGQPYRTQYLSGNKPHAGWMCVYTICAASQIDKCISNGVNVLKFTLVLPRRRWMIRCLISHASSVEVYDKRCSFSCLSHTEKENMVSNILTVPLSTTYRWRAAQQAMHEPYMIRLHPLESDFICAKSGNSSNTQNSILIPLQFKEQKHEIDTHSFTSIWVVVFLLLLDASAHAQQILIAAFVRTLLKWLAVLVKYHVSSFLDYAEPK